MSSHVGKLVSTCFYSLRRIKLIRQLLSTDAAKTLVNSLVMSQVDFCNMVLAGQPAFHLNRMQSVLSVAARVITGTRKFDHITPQLQEFHCLPVSQHVNYNLYLTVYKALNGLAPSYLSCLCTHIASC